MATAVRSYIDCREFPSEKNCSLKIAGTPDEVPRTETPFTLVCDTRP